MSWYHFAGAGEATYGPMEKTNLSIAQQPSVIWSLRQQNILQNLIKKNISNNQQTQYPLKTVIDKLLYAFYKKQLPFIKYTANLTPV